ncbi:hypothetical protein GBW32_17330 [Streptomyces tsukubensis]|uniref:Uncharacterized protein n=2 Tax=Streptomyces tsukubensis TaxID=83656 RepID=A0A1V4A1W7_9ACTN|nr:hypothetical protein B1H18_28300 [Streptomyces tsukubensis]QFR97818.1 hypothetical protein GBW32_17330 [Streptomyces tsukubensis]
MLYAGFIHSNAYYSYFHLDTFAIGFDSLELAVRSLRLATFPVLIALALVVVLPRVPELLTALGVRQDLLGKLSEAGRVAARAYPAFVVAGVVVMLLWRYVQPFGWAAPVLVAGGLLLGQTQTARASEPGGGTRGGRVWRRGVPIVVAGLFLMWAVALVAGDLGRADAHGDEHRIVRRVAVVVLSTDRLSMSGSPSLHSEDLGARTHYRYRYTGLRLLVERSGRYYLLPLDWTRATGTTYIIQDDDSIRLELLPGVQPRE